MSAVFAYARVSTNHQEVENQFLDIENSGYKIDYKYADVGVSGKTRAKDRQQWNLMLSKIREGESLIVSRIDRLGRNVEDILSTLKELTELKIKVIVLQLGNIDLTSSMGKLVVTLLSAVASLERDIIVERIHSGLNRARTQQKVFGRPPKTNEFQRNEIRQSLQNGMSVSELARKYNISRASVISIRNSN